MTGALLILTTTLPSPLAQASALAGNLQLGWAAYQRGAYGVALRELRPLAAQGHAEAQYLLAAMYARGAGVLRDYEAAVSWFGKAAAQGHVLAQEFLPRETWRCFALADFSKAAVLLYRLKYDRSVVVVAGVTYEAAFQLAGLERRWDFPAPPFSFPFSEGWTYPYSFTIQPDGTGFSYDFSMLEGGTKPSEIYQCRSD